MGKAKSKGKKNKMKMSDQKIMESILPTPASILSEHANIGYCADDITTVSPDFEAKPDVNDESNNGLMKRSNTATIKKVKVLHEMEIAEMQRGYAEEQLKQQDKSRLSARLRNRYTRRRASRLPSMRIQIDSNDEENKTRRFSAPKILIDGDQLANIVNVKPVSLIKEMEGEDQVFEEVTMENMTPDERRHSRRLSMSRTLSQQLDAGVNTAVTQGGGMGIDQSKSSNLSQVLSHLQSLKGDDSSIEDLDLILNAPLVSSEKHSTINSSAGFNATDSLQIPSATIEKPKKKKIKKVKRIHEDKAEQGNKKKHSDDTWTNVDVEETDISINLEKNTNAFKVSKIKRNVTKKKSKKKGKNVHKKSSKQITASNAVTYFEDDDTDDSIDLDEIIL